MIEPARSADLSSASLELIRVADIPFSDERRRVDRARERGELVTLSRGVHVAASRWETLTVDDRFRLRSIAARHAIAPGEVLSHHSAAALHGLPVVDAWPDRAETTVLGGSALTSSATLRRHRVVRPPETVLIDGILVTSLAQTVVDLATELPFPAAVAAGDAALGMLERREGGAGVARLRVDLARIAGLLGSGRGSARARRVLAFVDPLSESPGESITRAALHLLSAPAPVVQHRITGISGRVWRVDLGWPELGVVLEFDGRAKYTDPRLRQGRSAEQVVYDEKLREDDIRPRVRAFGRVDWTTARDLRRLASRVVVLGIPVRQPRTTVRL